MNKSLKNDVIEGGGGGPIKPEGPCTLDPNEGERPDPQKSKKLLFFNGF